MARAPAAFADDDDDDIGTGGGADRQDVGGTEYADIPAGLSGASDVPRGREPAGGSNAPEFEIVETDDQFVPLSERRQAEPEFRSDDARDDATRERQTPAERRAAQRRARERQARELRQTQEENARLRADFEALSAKIDGLEPRLSDFDQSRVAGQRDAIQRQIDETAQAVARYEQEMSDAIVAGDGPAHQKALREHTKAIQRGYDLDRQLQGVDAQRQAPADDARRQDPDPRGQTRVDPRTVPPPRIDPAVNERVRDYVARNPWFNTANPNRMTRIALVIDNEVYDDGFDPRDDDYWEELDARLREELPHRFDANGRYNGRGAQRPSARDADDAEPRRQQPAASRVPPARRGPMVGGASDGRGGAANGSRNTVYLNPERKQALMEIGALDRDGRIADKAKFTSLAQRYVEYDRANGNGAAR